MKLFLASFALTSLVSCAITVPNTRVCSVSGYISNGADCAYTLSPKTEQMTFQELLEFLEPQPERPDPKDPSKRLPARGGALCQSAEDWGKQKTALEQACKKLSKCNYEQLREALDRVESIVINRKPAIVYPEVE